MLGHVTLEYYFMLSLHLASCLRGQHASQVRHTPQMKTHEKVCPTLAPKRALYPKELSAGLISTIKPL